MEAERVKEELEKLGEDLAQLTVLEGDLRDPTSEPTNINNSGTNNVHSENMKTQSGSGHRAAQGEAAFAVALLSGDKKV